MSLADDTWWQSDSACREYPNIDFFPDLSNSKDIKQVKSICNHCLVREQCLDYAFDKKIDHGIWGGLTEIERNRVRPFRRLRSIPVNLPPVSTSPKPFVLITSKSFSLHVVSDKSFQQ